MIMALANQKYGNNSLDDKVHFFTGLVEKNYAISMSFQYM